MIKLFVVLVTISLIDSTCWTKSYLNHPSTPKYLQDVPFTGSLIVPKNIYPGFKSGINTITSKLFSIQGYIMLEVLVNSNNTVPISLFTLTTKKAFINDTIFNSDDGTIVRTKLSEGNAFFEITNFFGDKFEFSLNITAKNVGLLENLLRPRNRLGVSYTVKPIAKKDVLEIRLSNDDASFKLGGLLKIYIDPSSYNYNIVEYDLKEFQSKLSIKEAPSAVTGQERLIMQPSNSTTIGVSFTKNGNIHNVNFKNGATIFYSAQIDLANVEIGITKFLDLQHNIVVQKNETFVKVVISSNIFSLHQLTYYYSESLTREGLLKITETYPSFKNFNSNQYSMDGVVLSSTNSNRKDGYAFSILSLSTTIQSYSQNLEINATFLGILDSKFPSHQMANPTIDFNYFCANIQ